MQTGIYSELNGDVCFLLTVDYHGQVYRFSTFPVALPDENLFEVFFDGGLFADPNVKEQTSIVGFDLESETVSLEVIFPFDLIADFFRGRKLDNSPCEISMITMENGKPIQSYPDRIRLFSGRVIQPIIGTPERPSGYVAFSIENSQQVTENSMINESQRITAENWPFMHFPSSEGKMPPTVFGRPYNYPRPSSTGITIGAAECSPAYEVRRLNSGSPTGSHYNLVFVQIAAHEVEAETVTLHDFQNNQSVRTVATDLDIDGNIVSIVAFTTGSGLVHSKRLGINTDDIHYWVRWGDFTGTTTAGALPNPFGSGCLEGGGDVCRWALEKTGLLIDWGAWNGIAELLNRYKFAGYINEPISALDWVKENIIAHLPIDVVNGAYGLRPILSLYHYNQHFDPTTFVTDGGDFSIVSPLIPLNEGTDIVNRPVVRFAWSGKSNDFRTSMMIDPEKTSRTFVSFRDPISDMSFSRYGLHEKYYDLNYVYDINTATKILRDKVRIYGLPVTTFDVSAHAKFGFLRVGDVIALTSDRLSMTDHVCQIISKTWRSGRWYFVIHIEDNIHVNSRIT